MDDSAPVTTLVLSPTAPNGRADWFTTTPDITLSSSESGTSQYQWDSTADGGWVTSGGTIEGLVGIHTLYYRSVDVAGNTEDTKSQSIKFDAAEPADPSTVVSPHAAGSATNDTTIEMSWPAVGAPGGASDDASGVDGFSYSFTQGITDAPDQTKDVEGSVTGITSDPLADGVWYFHLRTLDNAGRWTSTVHYGPVTIDATAPVAAFGVGAKASGSYVRGTILIPVSAADASGDTNSGLADVRLLDGATLRGTDSAAPHSFALNTALLSNGSHIFKVRATDNAGNTADSLARTYNVDNYRPRTSAPYAASVLRNRIARLFYKASDPFSPRPTLGSSSRAPRDAS